MADTKQVGKWEKYDGEINANGDALVRDCIGFCVAQVNYCGGTAVAKKRAKLIAQAPALATALAELLEYAKALQCEVDSDRSYVLEREVIAAAEQVLREAGSHD